MLPITSCFKKKIPLAQLLFPWQIARHLGRYGDLIRQFTKRDIQSRYRGSYLGIFWSLLRPLCLLAVYTTVFGFIFQARFDKMPDESKLDFALALFAALMLFDLLSESVNRAPALILANTNYVTKVVFPLEVLPVSMVAATFVHLLISLVVMLGALLAVHHSLHPTLLYLPVLLVPTVCLCLGATWWLASLGVFIRDIQSVVSVIVQVLFWSSAVFYPLSKVPPTVLPFLLANPMAILVDQWRNAIMWGIAPNWQHYGYALAASLVVLITGYAFFMKTKHAFADVI